MTHVDPPKSAGPSRPGRLEVDRAIDRAARRPADRTRPAGADRAFAHKAHRAPSLGARLGRFLYPAPAKRTVGGIFKWWEMRRLAFTAIVGAGGAVSLASHGILTWLEGGAIEVPPIPGVLAMLLLANACYTLGPLTESLLHRLWGRKVLPVGPHLFRAGLALSVGISLLIPMLAAGARLAVLLFRTVFGAGLA